MSVGPVPLSTGLSPAVEAASVPSALITGPPLSWAWATGLKAMSPALRLRTRMNLFMDNLLGSGIVDGRRGRGRAHQIAADTYLCNGRGATWVSFPSPEPLQR